MPDAKKGRADSASRDSEFGELAARIERAQLRALVAANHEMIDLFWQIGKHVSAQLAAGTWEQSDEAGFAASCRARYSDNLCFSAQNIRRMRRFYETYKDSERLLPLAREISWSANLVIMDRATTADAREFYLRTAVREHYSQHDLERQMDSLLFERTMASEQAGPARRRPAS